MQGRWRREGRRNGRKEEEMEGKRRRGGEGVWEEGKGIKQVGRKRGRRRINTSYKRSDSLQVPSFSIL